MGRFFRVSIRFHDLTFHGRGDGGEPEWPPSPLRVFQALVAGAAARWNERTRLIYAVPALEWLSKQPPPLLIGPVGTPSRGPYRLYVPDNVGDLVAGAWRRGNPNASIADYRTEKDVRPTHLNGEAVHYLYSLSETDPEFEKHRQTLTDAARSITHLGWGVDMVAGNAAVIDEQAVAQLEGERWQPTNDGSGTRLRVPVAGTLDALITKHQAFLNRLDGDGFRPVPPLTTFDTVGYRRATDPASRLWAAFRINSVDPDARPPAFDTARRCGCVAGWVRHATGQVCDGWPSEYGDIASFVHGHDPLDNQKPLTGDRADERFMYLPLPSIERRGDKGEHVGMIRRVLIAAPPRATAQIAWIRRRLPGSQLIENGGHERGLLGELPTSDWVLGRYVGESRVWSTVTPVIRSGHDDGDATKAERLLRGVFVQAGLPEELVRRAELDWRYVGFRAGVELVRRFALPTTIQRLPAFHVRIRFPTPVGGPLSVGAGRYRGFGLFVGESGC